jgi:peptidoglycan/LPS O-acetylase OafA/YrhL
MPRDRAAGGELLTHVSALDGVRFLAFMGVFVHHAAQNRPALRRFTEFGALGVQVFFVLSGFLIGSILYDLRGREQLPLRTRLLTFYVRRGLRIFPLYYVALLVLTPLPALGFDMFGSPSDLPWNLAYLSNVRMVLAGRSMGGLSHFWSLSVEEHFYLIAPLLVLKLSSRSLARVCVAVWIACIAARGYYAASYDALAVLSFFQFDCLLFGVAAALLHAEQSFLGISRHTAMRLAWPCALAVPFLEAGARSANPSVAAFSEAFSQFAFSWATAGAILRLWTTPESLAARLCALPPFVYLGRISYGLYVWHFPLLLLTSALLGGRVQQGSSLIALGVTIAVASVSFYAFERPISGLKRYFSYRATIVRPSPAPSG